MGNFLVKHLMCEYMQNNQAVDVLHPRFSWQIESDKRGVMQRAYRILVAKNLQDDQAIVWDSGEVISSQSALVEYAGDALQSCTRYEVKVQVWVEGEQEGAESEVSSFRTAFLHYSDWKAKWISADPACIAEQYEGAVYLKSNFITKGEITSAFAYVSAKGMYECYINGMPATDAVLLPGWTVYHKRIQYQAFDISHLLKGEEHAIGVWLANGWYRGMGFDDKNYTYGSYTAAIAQIHIQYADGSTQLIVTDSSWKSNLSPITFASIYDGETYNALEELTDWATFGNDDSWYTVIERADQVDVLVAQENEYCKVTEELQPVEQFITPKGQYVIDFGQNMVGRVRIKLNVPKGTEITIKHAEVLDSEGNIYYGNLRTAKQTATYIAKGVVDEEYAPRFTFMGFRYIEIIGYPDERLPLNGIVGEVIHTDMMEAGYFDCSDERVNKLQSNIKWGQRGNFVDVPTDCPQRDERLGWTGDAQVFISTALFNYQGAAFFTKWLRDLRADQHEDGGVPFVIPDVVQGANSAAWGDAAVICPWTVYQYYGDKRLLSEQYESMKGWVEYIHSQNVDEYLWNTGFHFGDWLALDAKEDSYIGATSTALIATAYYAYSTKLLCQAAELLKLHEDAVKYSELYENIKLSFRREFITERGRMAIPTQTAHVLALHFDLAGEHKERIARDLNELIIENNYHLTTGFVGTPYLCFALSNNGYHETALKILLQESYPGWLYSVSKGATTIWEHWDSIKPDGSFWSDAMNSFNHYAYGAIGDWLYRVVGGLQIGYGGKRVEINPQFGGNKINRVNVQHTSLYGLNAVSWKREGQKILLQVEVPANVNAVITLKGAMLSDVMESGAHITEVEGVMSFEQMEGSVVLNVGSGIYKLQYNDYTYSPYEFSMNTRINDIISQSNLHELMKKQLPQLFTGPMANFMKHLSFDGLVNHSMSNVTLEEVQQFLDMLNEQYLVSV